MRSEDIIFIKVLRVRVVVSPVTAVEVDISTTETIRPQTGLSHPTTPLADKEMTRPSVG